MFKYATVKLSEIIVQALKQNQTMTDIEQTYFEEEDKEETADPGALADPAQVELQTKVPWCRVLLRDLKSSRTFI